MKESDRILVILSACLCLIAAMAAGAATFIAVQAASRMNAAAADYRKNHELMETNLIVARKAIEDANKAAALFRKASAEVGSR